MLGEAESKTLNRTPDAAEGLRRVRKKLPVVNKDFKLDKYNWHRLRRFVHLGCFLVFVSLPFFNVVRFDIPHERFYFAGFELWINEFAIVFFSLMFLLFVVAAASMLYGRIYCGYLCPQMIFSEASINLENKIKTFVARHFAKRSISARKWISRVAVYSVLGAASVFLAFVFISYFVEPRDLFGRLISFDIVTAGGIAGAAATLVTFIDFAFLRQKFCTTVCPYGYLQGILGDDNTLVVQYRDPENICVECKKCVRICHMGIDIRDSPFQIECIHCGECIDACKSIMGKFGKGTLVHYAWGEKGELLGDKHVKWYRRIGLRDAKRLVVLAIIIVYASALTVVFSMRHNVLVRVLPDRATLYRIGDDGRVYNTFRMTLANRGRTDAAVALEIRGLPDAELKLPSSTIAISAGESVEQRFEISVPASQSAIEVNHFDIVSTVSPDGTTDTFNETFIMPLENLKK